MPILNNHGVNIYYEVHGRGPVILLSHWFSATGDIWRDQIETLSRDHTVVTWDLRGHGRSDYPEDQNAYCEQAAIEDMAAILDRVGVRRAIVGGLSLGGYMSLAFCRAFPERVGGLLLISTGPGFKQDAAREAWNNQALAIAELLDQEGLAALHHFSAGKDLPKHRSAAGLARVARGMLTQHDARVIEALPGIKAPTLVIAGAKDTPYLAASAYMAARIPGAGGVIIPEAGHTVNVDQPEVFLDVVLPFLQERRLAQC